jgi:hypothetical protein
MNSRKRRVACGIREVLPKGSKLERVALAGSLSGGRVNARALELLKLRGGVDEE